MSDVLGSFVELVSAASLTLFTDAFCFGLRLSGPKMEFESAPATFLILSSETLKSFFSASPCILLIAFCIRPSASSSNFTCGVNTSTALRRLSSRRQRPASCARPQLEQVGAVSCLNPATPPTRAKVISIPPCSPFPVSFRYSCKGIIGLVKRSAYFALSS